MQPFSLPAFLSFAAAAWLTSLAAVQAQPQPPGAKDLKPVLAELEKYAESARQAWEIPGMAIAVVSNGQTTYTKGFGVKRTGGTEPVDPRTVFQIGSTSKAFTSALVAMLVDEGKVRWDDKVTRHVSDFEMYDPWVTREFEVQDLMAQHSGMPAGATDFLAISGFDADYIQRQIRLVKPIYSARSSFSYVNNLFLVAAKIVEQKTGMNWHQAMQKRIFDPLGMKESSTTAEQFGKAANAAQPHQRRSGTVVALERDNPDTHWAYTLGPAGGVNSNVIDLAEWVKLQLSGKAGDKQLLTRDSLNFLHKPATALPLSPSNTGARSPLDGILLFYCQGWVYNTFRPAPVIWHNGDNTYMHAAIGLLPDAQTGLAVLTNLGNTELAEAIVYKFHELYYGNTPSDWAQFALETGRKRAAAEQAPTAAKPANAASPLPFESYVGVFRNAAYGDVRVAATADTLLLTAGPKNFGFTLVPWERDTFLLTRPAGERYRGEFGFVRFVIDSNRKASELKADFAEDVDGGVFKRQNP